MNRRWIWPVWMLSLLVCPAGLLAVRFLYPDVAPYPPPWPSTSPPERGADGLVIAQALIATAPAAAAPFINRRTEAWLAA